MAWSQHQSGVLRGMATGAVATFLKSDLGDSR